MRSDHHLVIHLVHTLRLRVHHWRRIDVVHIEREHSVHPHVAILHPHRHHWSGTKVSRGTAPSFGTTAIGAIRGGGSGGVVCCRIGGGDIVMVFGIAVGIGPAVMSMISVMAVVRGWVAMAVATIMSIDGAQSGSFGLISVPSIMTRSCDRVVR